jgi:hypothetical protein
VTRDLCLQLSVHRSTSQPVYQSTVISCQSTSLPQTDNRKQKTHNSHLTTHNSLLHNYTIILTTNKPPLGLIEFSIQWLWSIDKNPSLELTFKCGFDTIFQKKNHSATGSQSPVYQFASHQSTVHSHHYTTSPQTDNR